MTEGQEKQRERARNTESHDAENSADSAKLK